MQIEVLKDGNAVADRAADIVADVIGTAAGAPGARIALPTGRTPIATYAELRRRVDAGVMTFASTDIFAIDEFAGGTRVTPGTNSAYYRRYARLGQRSLHCPDPGATDPVREIAAFANSFHGNGGIDLCVLGIGTNGHIAFNEPGSAEDSRARVVELTLESRAAHAEEFGSLDAVPARGMTLGVADLLTTRRIVVLATGAHKAAVTAIAIEGSPSGAVPASWLQRHARVTWLLDASAGSRLTRI